MSVHPQVATTTRAVVRRWRAATPPRPERLAAAGAGAVGGVGTCLVVTVELWDVAVRTAATATVLVVLAVVVGRETRRRVGRHGAERRHLAVDARTADELDRVAGSRWTVRHGVRLGDGPAAHLIADDREVHLVLAVWIPPRRAALQLRCAVAAAHAAARELEVLEVAGAAGRGRTVIPTVVAWGSAAASARAAQSSPARASTLLPGELWTWRVARGRADVVDAA